MVRRRRLWSPLESTAKKEKSRDGWILVYLSTRSIESDMDTSRDQASDSEEVVNGHTSKNISYNT
jgi:hypothetical protein